MSVCRCLHVGRRSGDTFARARAGAARVRADVSLSEHFRGGELTAWHDAAASSSPDRSLIPRQTDKKQKMENGHMVRPLTVP